ncbi:DUF1206 domain-containing protein [Xanthomonas sp. WHRI 8391]|uniref:DUF1206 domain-containing protein n=1 Tax=Xanthomonas TaxID=338 RepID=UPI001A1891C7|nr:DUF1206 domain-containing protein [Xanthomonas hortorum]MBG3851388.1 DUF1206 domain-containing protein [Xanthomonas hortorum pv. carotae]UTS74214.1 DUF1206 domain-containing protein [Xanthomonas hortorum]
MDRDSTFKEHYFWELQRRDSLNTSLAFPVGVVTLLFGATYAMSQSVSLDPTGWNALLLILLGMTAILLAVGVYYLVQAYWGYTYKHMPLSAKLLDYKEGLVAYHSACGKNDSDSRKSAEQEFWTELDRVYAENCEINGDNNDSKSSKIFRANLYIIAAIASVALCGLIFLWQSKVIPPKPSKIEITNLKELAVTQNSKPSHPPAQPARQPEPVRPTMPPSRDVKEHVDPKRK